MKHINIKFKSHFGEPLVPLVRPFPPPPSDMQYYMCYSSPFRWFYSAYIQKLMTLFKQLSLLAEMGFAACLIYVDPCDIPEDQPLMQKAFGVTLNPGGDPSTPEYPSTGEYRVPIPSVICIGPVNLILKTTSIIKSTRHAKF